MNKQLLIKKNVTSICALTLSAMLLCYYRQPVVVQAQRANTTYQEAPDKSKATKIVDDIRKGVRGPLYAGYYRTWHDKTATSIDEVHKSLDGANEMSKVPSDVDILFVFDSHVHEKSPFWNTLKNTYVPKLHEQGTAVVQTLGVRFLTGEDGISKDTEKYPNNDAGNYQLAYDIVQTYVIDRGLDGLDIDIEGHDYNFKEKPEKAERALKVFQEIAKLIGKKGTDQSKLLIIDTTLAPDKNPLFQETAESIDFLLRQYYGHQEGAEGLDNINEEWLQFKNYIKPEQFMIGFSFFEENSGQGNMWFDIAQDDGQNPEKGKEIEGTRAKRYAEWQPQTGGLKGGLFSYAIERDGVPHPTGNYRGGTTDIDHSSDIKRESDYEVSKKLKKVLREEKGYDKIDASDIEDEALRNQVVSQVGQYRGNLERFNGKLVINDPNIKSLKGLEKVKNLTELVIEKLPSIKKLSPSNLPDSLRRQKGKQDVILTVRDMISLEELDLSGLNRQTLENLDFNSMKSLKKIDLSRNAFDFSSGSKDLVILQNLLGKYHLTINFENQRPEGYVPSHFGKSRVYWTTNETGKNLINTFLKGAQTINGKIILDEETFKAMAAETINNRPFIDPNYQFNDFKLNYENYTVEVINHHLVRSRSNDLTASKDATYKLIFKDPNGKEVLFVNDVNQQVPQLELIVGHGEVFLDDLALGAKELYKTSWTDSISLFDGQYNPKGTYKEFNKNAVVFELKNLGIAKYWNLYRSGFNGGVSSDGDIIKASLKVLQNETEYKRLSGYDATLYLQKEENWKEIARVNDTGNQTLSVSLNDNRSRVFKVDFEETRDNFSVESVELQIVGEKTNDIGEVIATEEQNSGNIQSDSLEQSHIESDTVLPETEAEFSSSEKLDLQAIDSAISYVGTAYETIQEIVTQVWQDIHGWLMWSID